MKKLIMTAAVGAAYLLKASPVFALNLCGSAVGNVSTLCTVTLGGLVQTAINLGLFVAFVAALIYLIIGGIRWIMSGGDKEATAKAKSSVTAALIGLAIVLASWILINIILNFFGVGGLGNVNEPNLIPN